MFEAEGHAAKWCKAIGRLQRRANGEDDFPEEEWTQGSLEASVSEGHVEIVEDVGDEREGEARERTTASESTDQTSGRRAATAAAKAAPAEAILAECTGKRSDGAERERRTKRPTTRTASHTETINFCDHTKNISDLFFFEYLLPGRVFLFRTR